MRPTTTSRRSSSPTTTLRTCQSRPRTATSPGHGGQVRNPPAPGARRGRAPPPPPQYLAQHRPHLDLSERGADAAPHAAAERDPGVGLGATVDEPLRSELP